MDLKVIAAVEKIFLDTNFANLFALPGLFKVQAGLLELKTEKFVKWFDGLRLPIVDNVWINCANMKIDKQEVYGYDSFREFGYGELISRSIAIPAFIDKGYYADGGLYDNPSLTQWENETLPIFVSQLMMPYRTTPKSRIEKLSYAWDVKAFQTYQCQKSKFPNLTTLYPDDGEYSSLDFGMSKDSKMNMIQNAYKITNAQLEFLKIDKRPEPTPICLGLSGGGIRSGAHIGVVEALYENNYIPVKWSGTSGGSAFAVLFAGTEAKLNNATTGK